jgi:hypothetical protein
MLIRRNRLAVPCHNSAGLHQIIERVQGFALDRAGSRNLIDPSGLLSAGSPEQSLSTFVVAFCRRAASYPFSEIGPGSTPMAPRPKLGSPIRIGSSHLENQDSNVPLDGGLVPCWPCMVYWPAPPRATPAFIRREATAGVGNRAPVWLLSPKQCLLVKRPVWLWRADPNRRCPGERKAADLARLSDADPGKSGQHCWQQSCVCGDRPSGESLVCAGARISALPFSRSLVVQFHRQPAYT